MRKIKGTLTCVLGTYKGEEYESIMMRTSMHHWNHALLCPQNEIVFYEKCLFFPG